jgi:hypothetical protein
LNAFLQTWFHDPEFVQGVYQFPLLGDKNNPIYQLQLLFAALQYGALKAYNPRGLVESMNLRESEQQDANEFVCQVFSSIYFPLGFTACLPACWKMPSPIAVPICQTSFQICLVVFMLIQLSAKHAE